MRNRKPNRIAGYDYSLPGYYFVTINVHNRERVFGEIQNGRMVLNGYGMIAAAQWLWLYRRYSFLTPDAYVIMPDHVHGIVVIHDTVRDIPGCCVCRDRKDNSRVVLTCESPTCVESHAGDMPRTSEVLTGEPHACGDFTACSEPRSCDPRHSLLAKTINAYKTTSSKHIHIAGCSEFRWQRSYHDRIIRDRDELDAARNYIRMNPLRFDGPD